MDKTALNVGDYSLLLNSNNILLSLSALVIDVVQAQYTPNFYTLPLGSKQVSKKATTSSPPFPFPGSVGGID